MTKFDQLANKILKENSGMQSIDITGRYNDSIDVLATLVGDKRFSRFPDGVKGISDWEIRLPGVSFNNAVDFGIEIGLWEPTGGGLAIKNQGKWDEYFSETVSVSDY
jgi:hypothetical protein